MLNNNQIEIRFSSIPENEAFARMVISAYLMQKNPMMSLLSEVRTAVSEAVTNAIVHGYDGKNGQVILRAQIQDEILQVEVEDFGQGIEDIALAMTPFYTTQPEQERTGIGFALMQSFMDMVEVSSVPSCGTLVRMTKRIGG